MPNDLKALIDQFRAHLTQQRYNPVVIHNYCRSATHFLAYLARRDTAVDTAKLDHVSSYLRFARRHGTLEKRRFLGGPPRNRTRSWGAQHQRPRMNLYILLAEVVAVVHAAYVAFVVIGFALIIGGLVIRREWSQVLRFRAVSS